MYEGFAPAGGTFATLTSMAILGTTMPAAALFDSLIATGVVIDMWVCDIGRQDLSLKPAVTKVYLSLLLVRIRARILSS